MDYSDPEYNVDHHIYPQQYEDWFHQQGIQNIHDYSVTVTNQEHWDIHQAWNWEWQAFQYDHPTASRAEIENQAAQMMEDYSILDRYVHTYREGTGS